MFKLAATIQQQSLMPNVVLLSSKLLLRIAIQHELLHRSLSLVPLSVEDSLLLKHAVLTHVLDRGLLLKRSLLHLHRRGLALLLLLGLKCSLRRIGHVLVRKLGGELILLNQLRIQPLVELALPGDVRHSADCCGGRLIAYVDRQGLVPRETVQSHSGVAVDVVALRHCLPTISEGNCSPHLLHVLLHV